MDISPEGIAQIKAFEGLRLNAYRCQAGQWTIGYGHTSGVRYGQVITSRQAEALLQEDIQAVCQHLNALIKVKVTQPQFDALGSLVLNIGATAFASSTLLEKLNKGDYSEAASEFLKWGQATVHGQKRAIRGLMQRRLKEKALFERTTLHSKGRI